MSEKNNATENPHELDFPSLFAAWCEQEVPGETMQMENARLKRQLRDSILASWVALGQSEHNWDRLRTDKPDQEPAPASLQELKEIQREFLRNREEPVLARVEQGRSSETWLLKIGEHVIDERYGTKRLQHEADAINAEYARMRSEGRLP